MPTVQVELGIPDISDAVFDRTTGLMDPYWYRFFEEFVRAHNLALGTIDSNVTSIDTAAVAIADIEAIDIVAGNGLDGGGTLNTPTVTLDAKKDTGWTAGTGASSKGAFAAYAGQAVSVGYVQAEAQATDDAVKATAARVLALEQALEANEGIGA